MDRLRTDDVVIGYLLKSTDFGSAWSILAQGQDFSRRISVDPKNSEVLYGSNIEVFVGTCPATPAGFQVPSDRTYSTGELPVVTVNNIRATMYGAALAPGFAGFYQVAIQVPSSLLNGDWPIQASIGGAQSPTGVILSVLKINARKR